MVAPAAGGAGLATRRNQFGQPIGADLPEWRPAAAPPRTPMAGRHCRLEPLADNHAAALFDAFAAADDSLWTYMAYGPFDGPGAFAEQVARLRQGDDPQFHAIFDAAGPAGIASFMRIDPRVGTIEVGGITYAPRLQRTPAATEAMALMMARAFDELGYRRYEWKCDALNAASRRAALRLGFTFEGIFRQATVYKGRNRDTAWFSVIDGEWPALKRAFRAWLDPANFDAAGRQRRSLESLRA
jgi:RimJ/RimL family protein N-acetyltransferase